MKFWIVFFAFAAQLCLADAIGIRCRGPGASEDKFVYDTFFNVVVLDDDKGTFKLSSDGRGPGGTYDIDNRFNSAYRAKLERNEKGRPLRLAFERLLLDKTREMDVVLDLSRKTSHAELELEKSNGLSAISQLSCETTLPQVCHTAKKCYKHCYPMIGCDYICRDVTTCVPGKFASEN